jgi:predicted dithiol-disulfide oxidoreductase (DUF899 family)
MTTTTQRLTRWPAGASEEYVLAREQLRRAEIELTNQIERVAAQRRALPLGPALPEYVFEEGPRDLTLDGPIQLTTLADLVPDDPSLVMYHLMFAPEDEEACPMCSTWVDGLHGVSHHLAQRTAFVVVTKAPITKARAWARHRGWYGLRLLSSYGSTFNRDISAEDAEGNQQPGLSVFVKCDGVVHHTYTSRAELAPDIPERGIDLYCPVWQIWDLLPEGRGDWYAENTYAGRQRGEKLNATSPSISFDYRGNPKAGKG